MKKILPILLLSFMSQAQNNQEKLQPLLFGSIKPTGWLKDQMQKDIAGFVGQLDQIVPQLIYDPIYGEARLHKNSKSKDLGNHKEGDAAGDEQYKWWNSETQSNWWDGFLRNVFLLDDADGMAKVKNYVENILATQDEDGYMGIYDRELRYQFNSENGELWSKATLYRGLLAYYEYSKDEKVFKAVEKAVANVMQNYPINASSPFSSGTAFNGGVSHGLTFTDVLERMYFYTQNSKYRDYALFLYQDFSTTYQSEADAQLANILNPNYQLQSHGVHTFEHLRALIIARYASTNPSMKEALELYLKRIYSVVSISGGPIGDEWIAKRFADATSTGYEYCSIHELLDSYCLLFQKTANASVGDRIENTFYNAAQGARHPNHSCIAYLKTDNSIEMMGTKNGLVEPDRKQTRYKYSPAHQDVAVCCNPNAGRITPYFVQNSWMKESEGILVATLLLPNVVETTVNGNPIRIENKTNYPYASVLSFQIEQPKASRFVIKIRKPSWVTQINTKENYSITDDFIVIERIFNAKDNLTLGFDTKVQINSDSNGKHYFNHGALLYALPIEAKEIKGKNYFGQFGDLMYEPVTVPSYKYDNRQAEYSNGRITTQLINIQTGKSEQVELVPIGKTILRLVTF